MLGTKHPTSRIITSVHISATQKAESLERDEVQERNLQQLQAKVQASPWGISFNRPYSVRDISHGQGCNVDFKASPCRRIAPGILEQGCATPIREFYAFLKTASDVLLGPSRDTLIDYGTPSDCIWNFPL